MTSHRPFIGISLCILSLTFPLIAQAQQPRVSEPDAPATAVRPSTQAPPTSGVPHEIKFAAVLRDSSGKPLTETVSVIFSLYDQQEGGTPSWSEIQNVEPDAQGRYSVLLGAASITGVPAELFRESAGRWLGVRVLAPRQTEQPRVRWVSVPYALKAGDAETLGGRPASSYVVAADPQTASYSSTVAPSASNSPLASTLTGSGTAGFISKFTASTTLGNSHLFEKNGFIGLGTTTPKAQLDVVGVVSAIILSLPTTSTNGAGQLTIGGNTFLHSFGTNNTFVGASAGNIGMTGAGNTAVGPLALHTNTTGASNSAFGVSALKANTKGAFNSAFGSSALTANTTGVNNTAVGASALAANTTAFNNSAVGNFALSANTTGTDNSAFGANALAVNTIATGNSAFGSSTLAANTVGNANSAFGVSALNANTFNGNSAFGYFALTSNTTASGNSAFGDRALTSNTTGGSSAFGRLALFSNTTGFQNSAFGASALQFNTTGNSNAAFGDGALSANTTGLSNSALGPRALKGNITGSNNLALGSDALIQSSIGDGNAALGVDALRMLQSGGGNIAIGVSAGISLNSGSNNIYISSDSGSPTESTTIRIGSGQTATFIAGISGKTSANGVAVFVNASGQLGTITSSQRYKNDIADMAAESDLLMKLRPVSFYYKPELDDTHTRQYGLVAEEVAKIAPQLVVFDKEGAPQTVRYHFVNAMLLNEVQKQRQLVDEQKNTILNLQTEVQDWAARLARLEVLLPARQ